MVTSFIASTLILCLVADAVETHPIGSLQSLPTAHPDLTVWYNAFDQIDYDPGSYGPLHQPLPDPRTHPIGNDLPNLHNETYMAEVAKRLRAADGNGDSVREALQKIGRDLADPDFQFPGTL